MLVLSKDTRNIKTLWTTESNPHKLKYLSFFILGYGSCFFCLLATFLKIYTSYFTFFLYTCIYRPRIFRSIFFLIGFQCVVSGIT